MRRSRTGDWSVVIGPGPTVHFLYIFSFSSLVRVVANLRRCLHYHITLDWLIVCCQRYPKRDNNGAASV